MAFEFFSISKTIRNKLAVFVEGPSDCEFYSSLKIQLNENGVLFFHPGQIGQPNNENNEQIVKGKEAVIFAYGEIRDKQPYGLILDNCLFIVDRDYEPNLCTCYKFLQQEDMNCINITPHHSMENFYCTEENLRIIFMALGRNDLIFFLKRIDAFAKDTINYFLLRYVDYLYRLDAHHINSNIVIKEYDVFQFSGSAPSHFGFNEKLLQGEMRRLESKISINESALQHYETLKNKFIGIPENIKGHVAFNFLKEYLNHFHEGNSNAKEWEIRIKGFSKRIALNMDLVNGCGEVVYRSCHNE
jgi:hypothetical protein